MSELKPPIEDPIFTLHAAAMREASEPRDGITPTPVSYLVLCFFWLLFGGWYMGYFIGEFSGNGLAERSAGGPRPATHTRAATRTRLNVAAQAP